MPLPKTPSTAGRIPSLIAAKKGTRVINGKTFDIPKVDLVQSLFRGSDEDRAALREVWASLDASQKQELAVAIANQMPAATIRTPKEGERLTLSDTLSPEGKEIIDYMRGIDLPPERVAVLSADEATGKKKGSDSSAGSVVDGNKEPGDLDQNLENAGSESAADEVPTEEPADDTRPVMERRKLPDGMDPKELGIKDPNSDKSTSRISRQTPLRSERTVSIVEIPDPETGKPKKTVLVERDGRHSDQDNARVKKAEAGKPIRDNDMESVKSYKDPETGVSGQGFAGRSAADMTERSPNEVYNDTFRQILEGTRGEADRVGSLYNALRNSDSFHEDPRAAFANPRQMAEALWRNADQVSFLEARNPVSPIDRRRLKGDIESENVGSRYLGLPDTTPGQAARMAQEAGMPTSNNQLRSRAEEDILKTIEKEVALRYGGSGWGRKYDAKGNLVDPGVGISDTPSNLDPAPAPNPAPEGISTGQSPSAVPARVEVGEEGGQSVWLNSKGEKEQTSYADQLAQYEEEKAQALRRIMKPGYMEPDAPMAAMPQPPRKPAGPPRRDPNQGVWVPDEDDPVKDLVDQHRQAAHRQAVQEHVGDLPRNNPGSSGSGVATEYVEKPDSRKPEQVAADNASKQAAWEANREAKAERFNSYSRDKNMQGVIKTRRTAREVQADIDAAYDRGTTDAEIAKLNDELRQAKILDAITSRIENVRAKSDTGSAGDVGTDDAPAVSTRGRQGQTTDPFRKEKGDVRSMAEQARDRLVQQNRQPSGDPNAALNEAANSGPDATPANQDIDSIDDPNSPNYIPPVNAVGEVDGSLSGPPEGGPAPRVDASTAVDDVSPEDLALESAATPVSPDPVATPDAPVTPDTTASALAAPPIGWAKPPLPPVPSIALRARMPAPPTIP